MLSNKQEVETRMDIRMDGVDKEREKCWVYIDREIGKEEEERKGKDGGELLC